MDASTDPRMAFPLPSGKQVLGAFSWRVFLWAFLSFPGISLVAKEAPGTCEDAEILQGVTGKRSSHPLSLHACQGRIMYYEITLANDPTLSRWLKYNISTNTHEGRGVTEKKSEGFQLTVVAHGEACEISTAKAGVTLHGQDRICVHAKNIVCSGGWYAKHLSITFAEIVLQMDNTLEIKGQLELICTMAEYLHLHPSSLTLIPVGDSLNKYFRNLTVLAEGMRYINSTKRHHVGLCWPVGFGVFAMLPELVRVLSHNVESDNLSQLLGYEIVGWRVLKQGYDKRNPRKIWQNRKMATPKPTWRPSQTENFTIWIAAVPETHSVVKSEGSSSVVNKTTFSVIHPYVDLSTQPVMVNVDLETIGVSKSTMFHYLPSELSPSLMLSSTEFEEKGTFETPPISEHLLYGSSLDTPTQGDFPTTQKSEPKYNSTFYYFSLFMSMTENHLSNSVDSPRDILPEAISSSTSSSPEFLSGEFKNPSDHFPFMHRTTGFKFGEIISIIDFSLPSMATSSPSSELSFSSDATSLLFLHDSCRNPKLLNVDSSLSDTFMAASIKQTDLSKWIKSSIMINIPSILDATITEFHPKLGSLPKACPSTQHYYWGGDPTSSKHPTDTLNDSLLFSNKILLTFSLLTKTMSNPVLIPSFSSVSVELTLLFGSGHIFTMEKLSDRRQVCSHGMNPRESFTTIPPTYRFVTTGNSVLVVMKTETDTSLWIKGTTLFYITTSSVVILSSRFLHQGERAHGESQRLSYGSSWITLPLQLAHTSTFHFSTNQCDCIRNLVRTPVLESDALSLDTDDLSSLLVNKTTFSVIHPYVDLSTQPVMVNVDLETIGVSKSTMFHYLPSELSPSLMLSSTEFEEKGTFETPPISEHLLYGSSLDTPTQGDFPTTQKSEPKYNSTFYYFSLFMSMTENHLSNSVDPPRDILPETISSSTSSSPEFLSGELSDHSLFMHRTTTGFKFGEIISIIAFSLPSIKWLSYGSSWITPPLGLSHSSSFHFSTNQYDSIHNLVQTPVLEPDALLLDTNGLSLEGSFGTKTNVQITRDIVSTSKAADIVFSRNGVSVENGLHATSLYQKTQGQPNTPPRVIHAIEWIAATVGHEFTFLIPPETFHDQEDGDSTQLTLGMNPIDGSPTDLESWLQLNAKDRSMYGYPLATDFQYSPQEFVLFATDSGGLKTEDKFIIQIFKPTSIPCHVYTVIVTNSYHSFLKNRTRVHFFFKKLCDYLLVASPADVVLLHLKTGSAVFAWYNKSLCPKTEKCARDDIQDVLTKLGRPREDIHPEFVEAMLPEFKIEEIGEVGYAGICLSATKPTNESLVFNRTVTGFNGGNCWITNTLTALLIAVCSTTLVFLIVFHCQKYRKKIFQPQCSPPCGHIDFKMDTPTSRQSPLLEEDVAPSTGLPLPVSMVSQQRSFRPHRALVISRLPSPPKYRLPPLYGRRDPG